MRGERAPRVKRPAESEPEPQAERKLEVGAANSAPEREADAVADDVMAVLRSDPNTGVLPASDTRIRRVEGMPAAEVGSDGGPVPADVAQAITSRQGGAPLSGKIRPGLESAFGTDFSGVRIHKDSEAAPRLGAAAFTLGSDVHFAPGRYDAGSDAGLRTIAHELAHVVQQGGASPAQVQREDWEDTEPAKKAIASEEKQKVVSALREKNKALLDAIASSVAPDIIAAGKTKVFDYLCNGLGVGGANWKRSNELKRFRALMKSAARLTAYKEIEEITGVANWADDSLGPATKDYLQLAAKDVAYKESKEAVDEALTKEAEAWLAGDWNDADISRRVEAAAIEAAWEKLKADPVSNQKKAQKAAAKAATEETKAWVNISMAKAKAWKNRRIKPDLDPDSQETAKQGVAKLYTAVEEQAKASKVGEKSLKTAIEANTTDAGLGKLGKMLDQVIPEPGESVSLSVELKIPIGQTPGFVSLKLEGKAGRGITGYTTSGVTTLGDPKRLEIMGQFTVGGGVELAVLEVSAGIGFFTRAGSDKGTRETMKALSYGGYRAAVGLSKGGKFGDWWAGKGHGTDLDAAQRSEMWAAMIEEQVFAADENAFADVGMSGSGGVAAKGPGVEMEGGIGGEIFKRYDKEALEKTLGKGFAQPVEKGGGKKRRKQAGGRTVKSFNLSESVTVQILGQGVGFAGGVSFEAAKGDDNQAYNNFGAEFSASLSLGPGDATKLAKIAAGFVAGGAALAEKLVAIAKDDETTSDPGRVADMLANYTKVVDAGLENKITDGLAGLAKQGDDPVLSTGSTLTFAVTFGVSGGKGVFRFELRDAKALEINVGILNISAEKSQRLLGIGYEDEQFVMEILGNRKKKK